MKNCIFLVYFTGINHIIKILVQQNINIWHDTILPTLHKFYYMHLLPELTTKYNLSNLWKSEYQFINEEFYNKFIKN